MKLRKIITASIIILFVLFSSSSTSAYLENNIEYGDGYALGNTVRLLGESFSCNSFVKTYNSEAAKSALIATSCFCKGYKDALRGRQSLLHPKSAD